MAEENKKGSIWLTTSKKRMIQERNEENIQKFHSVTWKKLVNICYTISSYIFINFTSL